MATRQILWKNAEDELLKAAVMKYGLNEWPRISSLFPNRDHRAVKTRWTEYLDPTLHKLEWNRDEDRKLMELERAFPTQWRLVGQSLGRSARACRERFSDLVGLGIDLEMDIHAIPASLDPVDMQDEDEDMLAEARARLANTMGKKAKRKEREKMLEKASEMETLAKSHELRAIGIHTKEAKRKELQLNIKLKEVPEGRYKPEINVEKLPDLNNEISNNELIILKSIKKKVSYFQIR